MLSIVQIIAPFFALVLLGYIATRQKLLPVTAIAGLNAFVLFFALPCMLFRFGASTPIEQLLDTSVLIVYLPCAMIMVSFTIALTLSARNNWNNAALGALVAAFPNTGFMGMPLLLALLGSKVAGPVIMSITIDMVITTSLCVALSRMDSAGKQGAKTALKRALLGMASNPMPWAILLGTAFSALRLELLGSVAKTVELLGLSASPVALFTIGAVLARGSGHSAYTQSSASIHDFWLIAILKLFLHPVLVLLVGICAIQLGVPLDPFALKVIVLIAALPSASNVVLLAERFGADTARIAHIIMVSTVLAFFTFTGAVALLT